jgi:hypothetical protein
MQTYQWESLESSGHYSSSSLILPENAARVANFQVHLMLHMSIKLDNTWTKMITWYLSILKYGLFRSNDTTATPTPA